MKIKTIIIVLGMLLPLLSVNGQEIRPLNIGDTVPDLVLHNVINYKDSVIRLSDFKDKLVILDFWSTYCGSCIEVLPRYDSLQKLFGKSLLILPVTYQGKDIVTSFLQKTPNAKGLSLPIAINDTLLSVYFPHSLLSHEVWIYKGRVKAITYPEYVKAANIQTVLEGAAVNWAVKQDNIHFGKSKPILQNGLSPSTTTYYAAIMPHIDGVPNNFGAAVDSTRGTIRTYIYNMTIPALYLFSFKKFFAFFPAAHIELDVKDTSSFRYMPSLGYRDEWERQHTFTYESVLPLKDTANGAILYTLRATLDRQFGLHATLGRKMTKCYVLVQKGKKEKKLPRAFSPDVANKLKANKKIYTLSQIKWFVESLNGRVGNLPVVDETNINQDIGLALPVNILTDMPALNSFLKPYGLALEEAQREIEMFTLSDHPKLTTSK